MTDNAVIPEPRASELIDEIMDNFAFGKVEKMMRAVWWCWGDSRTTPEEYELRLEARKMLREVARDEKSPWIQTGGFTARRECGTLTLMWGEEWTAGGEA